MKDEEYHKVLQPVVEACRLAKTGWICLPNPLLGFGQEGGWRWKVGVLFRHIGLLFRCWGARAYPHILVREFSTIPLLLVFPFLWPLRRKLYFLMNHNLQWAQRSRVEQMGLVWLARMGVQWAIFETQCLSEMRAFSIPSERNLVLALPVSGGRIRSVKNDRVVIGVAGYYRPEKGMDTLLQRLAKHFPECDLVIGAADPQQVPDLPGHAQAVDTALDADYRRMLSECDVLVQNGARESYFYRASGPVADAAACGTAVVVPDYPMLRHQVSSPVPVGEVFQSMEHLPDAVRAAIESVRSGHYDFDAYCKARSAQALADSLDAFSRRQNG